MSRVSRGYKARRRRKAVLKRSKGYFGRRKNTFRVARETVIRAGVFAYSGRKQHKREMRKLWIQRINAAARQHGLKYSTLMDLLSKADVKLDRKMLADLAYNDPEAFEKVVESAKAQAA